MTDPTLTQEEADQLAAFLNQVSGATLDALQTQDAAGQAEVASTLRTLSATLAADSAVGAFVAILITWLEGTPPSREQESALPRPFRRALRTMRRQVRSTTDQPRDPISRHVLAQLVTAVVAATATGDAALRGKLATQLLNIQNQLDERDRQRVGPLLENLRAVLGGADPRTLPPVSDERYGRFWTTAVELLIDADLSEEQAHDQLLQRLIHNTRFVQRAQNDELTAGFLNSLAEVGAEAQKSGAESIALLITAIQARLRGGSSTDLVAQLDVRERTAWRAIVGTSEASE